MSQNGGHGDLDMQAIARRVVEENGFRAAMPADLEASIPTQDPAASVTDLRALKWSSIDNQESQDLDQVEWAERLADGAIRVLVGIADVDAYVPAGSPVDQFAAANTSSLYTGITTFPMLPRVLSEHRTSLLQDQDHLAMVTEIVVAADGTVDDKLVKVYRARVRNYAKLVYETIGEWLEGHASHEPNDAELGAQVKLQDEAAQRLRKHRVEAGALDFETVEARAVSENGRVVSLEVQHQNRARQLIEDIMVATNGATARYLEALNRSSVRRVVLKPKRWDRIVALAAASGYQLPAEADSKALAGFLRARKAADPDRYPELSLSIVKLLGPGQYVVQRGGAPDIGHFGLAVEDYQHSTAPNRRYPDLVTQRLLKAAAAGAPAPYNDDQLTAIADHCTERENAGRKVERTMRKVAAAAFLSTRIGEVFDAIVTGVGDKGTFARLVRPPAEGRIVENEHGLDVGDRLQVRLIDTSPAKGFIDFSALR